ncbi:ExbD/TolR family protein [Plastorhodobacter daqingensis]|uniref:ExbD/TolR family protein n=1 Tax=Plastorhodobacter daqingensis TaxID=1387281 RepID=A0ABW2UNJ1_9RHOB
MNFQDPPRRAPSENMLPMINVVFLLLIFFLISAQLAPPEPFPVDPPLAEAEEGAEAELTLFLAADGELGFRDITGEAALEALAAARVEFCALRMDDGGPDCAEERPPLVLRADAQAPAARLAALMPELGALGFSQVHLVTALP